MALVRRDLIRQEQADFAGEEAYRFRHVLIRDAAYRSLPKNARADLHERYAAWLERSADGRLREFEEIVGYHFEQAFNYRIALGARNARANLLAAQACERLEAAGRRALVRSDLPAAISLLERVSRLLVADDPRRAALLVEIGAALIRSAADWRRPGACSTRRSGWQPRRPTSGRSRMCWSSSSSFGSSMSRRAERWRPPERRPG